MKLLHRLCPSPHSIMDIITICTNWPLFVKIIFLDVNMPLYVKFSFQQYQPSNLCGNNIQLNVGPFKLCMITGISRMCNFDGCNLLQNNEN
jgi:hypothetical protein